VVLVLLDSRAPWLCWRRARLSVSSRSRLGWRCARLCYVSTPEKAALIILFVTTDVTDIAPPEKLRDEYKSVEAFAEQSGAKLYYVQGDITDKAFAESFCQSISTKEGRFE
jgi:hypothetical protein